MIYAFFQVYSKPQLWLFIENLKKKLTSTLCKKNQIHLIKDLPNVLRRHSHTMQFHKVFATARHQFEQQYFLLAHQPFLHTATDYLKEILFASAAFRIEILWILIDFIAFSNASKSLTPC